MSTSPLTPTQLMLLRTALGLSRYTTKPTRNWLPGYDEQKYPDDVAELVRMGYLKRRQIVGQAVETIVEITDAGRAAVLQAGDA